MEFRQHKRDYYCHKLGYSKVTEAVLREQVGGLFLLHLSLSLSSILEEFYYLTFLLG